MGGARHTDKSRTVGGTKKKKGGPKTTLFLGNLVAGAGFEPATFGL